MRQQHHLADARQLDQLRVHRRLVLEHVEPGAGDVAGLDQARERILVDHFAARGVDDERLRAEQLQPPRREQVIGPRRVRAIHRYDVHAGEHLVEALPIGGVELFLDLGRHPAAIVVMDLQAEGARAARHRLADPSHADDAEPLAPNAVAEHPGRRPAGPFGVGGQHSGAFHQPPRHRQHQRHGHVGGILGEHPRRVGDGDPALHGGGDVDIVDAVAEIGDQLELLARFAEHRGVDAVGDGRHQHVGGFHRLGELALRHRLVVGIEPGGEKFPHAQLDAVRQLAGDDD